MTGDGGADRAGGGGQLEPDRTRAAKRPRLLPELPEALTAAAADPASAAETRRASADAVARALVTAARDGGVSVERLVRLADEVGLEELDAVWRDAEPGSLAGALRVLYLLRTWACARPRELARLAGAGRAHAEVSATVAGVPSYPSPPEMRRLVDDVLRGALERDLPTALHRAAALCRVVAAGRGAQEPTGAESGAAESVLGARLLTTAEGLDVAGRRLRGGSG